MLAGLLDSTALVEIQHLDDLRDTTSSSEPTLLNNRFDIKRAIIAVSSATDIIFSGFYDGDLDKRRPHEEALKYSLKGDLLRYAFVGLDSLITHFIEITDWQTTSQYLSLNLSVAAYLALVIGLTAYLYSYYRQTNVMIKNAFNLKVYLALLRFLSLRSRDP